MTKRNASLIALAVIVPLLMVSFIVSRVYGQTLASFFNNIVTDRLLVQSGGLEVRSGSTLQSATVVNDMNVCGTFATPGLVLSPTTPIPIVDGSIFTPTTSYYGLEADAEFAQAGMELSDCRAGLVTVLQNSSSLTLTISDTNASMLTSDFAMGQFDTLTVIGDGEACYEVTRSDN